MELGNSQILLTICPFGNLDTPPLGIATLAATVKKNGFHPEIFDLNAEAFHALPENARSLWNGENMAALIDANRFKRIAQKTETVIEYCCNRILESSSPIVGFSLFTPNVRFSNEVAQRVKSRDPERKIIMGGPSCHVAGERRWISPGVADAFFVGEAEEVLCRLLATWPHLPSLPCEGIAFERDRNYEVPIITARTSDLNIVPFPDFSCLNPTNYLRSDRDGNPLIPIAGSRGCIMRCAFCNERHYSKSYRTRRPRNTFAEMEHQAKQLGFSSFFFTDLLINGNLPILERLADLIIQNDFKCSWIGQAVARGDMTEEILRKLRLSGLEMLTYGIESGSRRVLQLMNKNIQLLNPEQAIRRTHLSGIITGINLMVGFPGETEEMFQESLSFLKRNRKYIDLVENIHPFYITPMSPVEKNPSAFGIQSLSDSPLERSVLWVGSDGNCYEQRRERVWRLLDVLDKLGISYPGGRYGLLDGKFERDNHTCFLNTDTNLNGGNLAIEKHSHLRPCRFSASSTIASSTIAQHAQIPRVTLCICPPWGIDHPPISLGYLAGYLKRANITYEIFDLNIKLYDLSSVSPQKSLWQLENDYLWREGLINETMTGLSGIENLVEALASTKSPLVGFSVIDPNQYISCKIIKRLKEIDPHKAIVVGGPACATIGERKWLQNETDNQIDFMVMGEGEKPLVELIQRLNEQTTKGEIDIPNVVDCRHNESMELNSMNDPIDLTEIAYPDYDGFSSGAYKSHVAAVMWSRGCISNCTFCKEKSLWDRYRNRDLESIIEEFKFYEKKKITEFVVYDSLVNGNPRHLERLCDRIISERLNIRWSALAIPDKNLTKALLRKMKRAGCFVLIFGLESGSEIVLKRMRKKFVLKDAIQTIKDTKSVGIETAINIIVGFPGENGAEFQKTIDLIESHHEYIDRVDAVTPLQLVRGTYLFNHHRNYDIVLPKERENELWVTSNGSNTYETRMKRRRSVLDVCARYGIKVGKHFVERPRVVDQKKEATSKKPGGLDIVFIHPIWNALPDYQTASILEYLKKYGSTAACWNTSEPLEPIGKMVERLSEIDVNFVAVKASLENLTETFQFVSAAKSRSQSQKIILWGSGCKTETLRKTLPLDLIDGIIFQEYESTFKRLIQSNRQNTINAAVPGVIVPGRPYIPPAPTRNLSKFPFPCYEEFAVDPFEVGVLPIRLSRGCPYRCTFCSVYCEEGHYKVREPKDVYEEVQHHFRKNSISEYFFPDNAINGNPDSLSGFCNLVAQGRIPLKWKAKYIAESCDKNLFKEMAEAGCTQLDFGFVSGSDRILSLMGKPFDAIAVENAIREAHASGIRTAMGIMVGFPGEEEHDFLKTVSFLHRNKGYINEINTLTTCRIQPGCDIEMFPEKYGIVLPKVDPAKKWHDGSYRNFSYRVKKMKELAILLVELKLIPSLKPYLRDQDALLKHRKRIIERYMNFEKKITAINSPAISDRQSSDVDEPPIIKGIRSRTGVYAGPELLEIDLTNNCNLQCIGCWCHSPLLGDDKFKGQKKAQHLPGKKVLSLIEEAGRLGTRTIQLSGSGEPFLHPEIWKIIENVKNLGMDCAIITNFTLLDQEMVRRLVDLEVTSITASVWAGDTETYLRTHPGALPDLFDRIHDNLSFLTTLRTSECFPRLKIYHVISTENAERIGSMVDFALEMGADAVEFQMIDVVPGKTDHLRPGPSTLESLLDQFKDILKRPDFTKDFIGTDHIKRLNDQTLEQELVEFGRLYRTLPKGFSYLPDHGAIRCPTGKQSIEKRLSTDDFSVTFVFDTAKCDTCRQKKNCWNQVIGSGQLRIHPMEILGVGSFMRRLKASKKEIQQYERHIIDRLPCTVGWTYARINVDGDVIPCCKAGKFPMGNIFVKPFSKIWEAALYGEFRQKALELPKSHPYFEKIDCYKSCDNVGVNMNTYLKFLDFQGRGKGGSPQ